MTTTLSFLAAAAVAAVQSEGAPAPAAPSWAILDPVWLVFGGALISTFVASVMAKEQDARLRNGTFGALAGTAVGGLAQLISKEQDLLLVGFCGSALGALFGWIVSLALALYAGVTERGKVVLTYLTGGFEAVRDSLELEERGKLISALSEWGSDFARRVDHQKEAVLMLPSGPQTNQVIELALRGWLDSMADMLRLLFQIANKPDRSSRFTLIVFGSKENSVVGRHWIHGVGTAKNHNLAKSFNQKSIGYKVLQGALPSPHFMDSMEAKSIGQDREQGQSSEAKYRPFLTFRLSDAAIIAIDWPIELNDKDEYVKFVEELFQSDICPDVAAVLSHWDGPLARVVDLDPLPDPPPKPEP